MTVVRQQTATTASIPSPVGGLNARDALNGMPLTDASVMTNLFPYADRVATRNGFTLLSTASTTAPGVASGVVWGFRALMMHASLGVEQVFGAFYWVENVAGSLYKRLRFTKIATDGTLTTSRELVTVGSTDTLESLGESTQFTSGSGTTYLLILATINNGASTFRPNAYDGTNWTAPSITGVPAGTMGVHVHRNRLWFYGTLDTTAAPKGLSAYYLPLGAISGAAVEFNLGPFASRGGRIVAIRTWTLDGGTGGADDLAVFLTDRGQAIVYEGTDPSALATWRLVGVFDVGKPSSGVPVTFGSAVSGGQNMAGAHIDAYAMKYGADLLFLLEDGVSSANRVLRPQVQGQDYTLSSKIRPLFTDAAVSYGSLSAAASNTIVPWKMIYYGAGKQLIVTIPTTVTIPSGTGVKEWKVTGATWYVMNPETGAWAKFDGLNVWDALVVGTSIYFTDGSVNIYKYSSAALDDAGTTITWECRQAYNNFGSANTKLFTLMQPMLRSTGNFSATAKVDVDFNGEAISSYTSYTLAAEANVTPWSSPGKLGRYAAIHLKGQTSVGVVSWYATNWAAKPGGLL